MVVSSGCEIYGYDTFPEGLTVPTFITAVGSVSGGAGSYSAGAASVIVSELRFPGCVSGGGSGPLSYAINFTVAGLYADVSMSGAGGLEDYNATHPAFQMNPNGTTSHYVSWSASNTLNHVFGEPPGGGIATTWPYATPLEVEMAWDRTTRLFSLTINGTTETEDVGLSGGLSCLSLRIGLQDASISDLAVTITEPYCSVDVASGPVRGLYLDVCGGGPCCP